jgi:ABC-type sugar transport system substrate-binding protein
MPLTDTLPTAVRRPVEQLNEAGAPVVTAVREAVVRAGETARTLAYAYVGALDLAQEQLLRAAGFSR